jgi:hypothetical protein
MVNMGVMPRGQRDIMPHIIQAVEEKEKYDDCRKVARKHYGWSIIIFNILRVYRRLCV